jgi:hypothetical protein
MTSEPTAPPTTSHRRRDWMALGSLVFAALSAITCTPLLTGIAAFGGVISFQRARHGGAPTLLPRLSLIMAGVALAVQIGVTLLANRWLAPAMQKRTAVALTAAIGGDHAAAIPALPDFLSFAQPLPAPDAESMTRFAAQVRQALGELRSISQVNDSVGGSALSPTVSKPLVLEFERQSATGWARVQWVPASDPEQRDWLPAVRVLEVEIKLPDGSTARLAPDSSSTSP